MSAEDNQEDKQLAPSEQRLQKAREEGQVARSRELTSFCLLGAATLGFVIAAPTMWNDARQLLASGLTFHAGDLATPAAMGERLTAQTMQGFIVAGPLLLGLMFVGAVSCLAVGGWNFTWKPVMPQWSRIDPMAGVGRIFSKQGFAEMAKLIGIVTILFAVSAMIIWTDREDAAALAGMPVQTGVASLGSYLLYALAALLVVLAVAASADVPLQIWRHHSQLKMTLEEAKQEAKESEGDPHLKAKIRQQQRAMSQRRMMENVATADVIVTNPTHYSVALRYDETGAGAPRVVAKGVDLIALRIRELAAEHRVPVLEAPPLARALYAHTELDQEVPVALYKAVAQVLAYVFQLRQYEKSPYSVVPEPKRPEALDVPRDLDPHEADGVKA
jgi:flagellar biosynthesis protein FlhB